MKECCSQEWLHQGRHFFTAFSLEVFGALVRFLCSSGPILFLLGCGITYCYCYWCSVYTAKINLMVFHHVVCCVVELKYRDFFCYSEIFLPTTRGSLGCRLGIWPSGPKPCGWTSRLDYCNGLLYGLTDCLLNKVQRVQNACATLIFREQKFCHVTPLIYELQWLPIKYRIDFKILLITFKILNSLAPTYLSSLVSLRLPSKYNLIPWPSRALSAATHKYLCHESECMQNLELDYCIAFIKNSIPAIYIALTRFYPVHWCWHVLIHNIFQRCRDIAA